MENDAKGRRKNLHSDSTFSESQALPPEDDLSPNLLEEKWWRAILEDEDVETVLPSRTRLASDEADWDEAEDLYYSSKNFDSMIIGFNRGGLIVSLKSLRGFVPASQVSQSRRALAKDDTLDERWGNMVGETIKVRIIEVDRMRRRLILSEKETAGEMRGTEKDRQLKALKEGDVRTGRVTSLADFGAFVNIGGVDGLVHLSEISRKRIEHPREVLRVGQEVKVKVISINPDRTRIGLSIRHIQSDPWIEKAGKLKEGQLIKGTITFITKFGAFVRLGEDLEGLIHISELSEQRISHPKEVVKEGDELTLRVIKIDFERRRIGLSFRKVESSEYSDLDRNLNPVEKIKVSQAKELLSEHGNLTDENHSKEDTFEVPLDEGSIEVDENLQSRETSTTISNIVGLKKHKWSRFLSAPDVDLLELLYVPGLSQSLSYDRSCAYFSSRVLSTAARGFGGLIQNLLTYSDEITKPAVRLLVNEQLDRKDIEHLLTSGDQDKLIETLLKRFKTPREALEKNRLQMLAWLVASGWLEVKVGLMVRTGGIAHAKYGILTDRQGNRIAFMGSDNETDAALVENYEELEIRPDWEDKEFVDYYQSRFETLWKGEDPHVEVLPLPEAVRQKLIRLAPKNRPEELLHDPATQEAAILWHFIAAAPYLPLGEYACDATAMVDPWPHQRRVVEDTAKGYPAGRLLCDEVGMGKTIEAILVLRRLLAGRGVKRALLLVPAGLLRQWQDELREKGGLIVPRWEDNYLAWPDGQRQKADASKVFTNQDILLISREWARLPGNRETVLNAPVWDLVLMDEAHAARRSTQKEREFNSANLLLELLRELQLRQRAKSILLLSATPMQTQPWEPWDLLTTLGVGDEWMVEFEDIRQYYHGIQLLRAGDIGLQEATVVSRLVVQDDEFPYPPQNGSIRTAADLAEKLTFAFDARDRWADWLRKGAPLGRRMHRNTRGTLKRYYQLGLLDSLPPKRQVFDDIFEYADVHERQVYNEVKAYINERYEQLEIEKTGKGFVMTIYHRRASSSPLALRRSLNRRKDKLERIIKRQSYDPLLALEEEQVDLSDLIDADLEEKVDPGLPTSPQAAETEKHSIDKLLTMLDRLGATNSKLEKFFSVLDRATKDGRPVLVFTEYTDTMEYLREQLKPTYGATLGCYSGRGGEILLGHQWIEVPKSEITDRLSDGALKVLICTDAASEGLNLQAAGALINYDLPWNPSKVEQRIGRIDRIGQKQLIIPVFNLFLDDSVDMRVYEVLQERCGLFEQFVGKMQPVLALARSGLKKILSPQEEMKLIQEMRITAKEVEKDETIGAEFAEAEAIKIPEATPPVNLKDLETGIHFLKKINGKIKVRSTGEKQWSLRGIGRKAIRVSTDLESLERDKHLTPLSAGTEIIGRIRDTLPLPSRSPLIIAERMNESHRCVEARWIQGEQILPVNDFAQLQKFIKVWDGKPVSPKLIHQAYEEAEQSAFERMMQMDFDSGLTVREGLEKQVEAARLRLRREVGRTLRCFGSDNLNNYFRKQVQAENSPESRYHQTLRRLEGYPEWTTEELLAFGQYVSELTEEQQNGRTRLGSEIDAALKDPRWEAEKQLRKKAKFNVILEKDYEEFTPKEQERFIYDMARAIKVSPNKIQIVKTSPGSTIITLEYESDEEASRFVSMYINRDPAIQMFGELRIAGIIPSQLPTLATIDGQLDLAISQSLWKQREAQSLRLQIDEHHRRILELQEKMTKFTDPRNVSPDLEEALNWHQEQMNQKIAKLNNLIYGNS